MKRISVALLLMLIELDRACTRIYSLFSERHVTSPSRSRDSNHSQDS